MNWLIEEMDKKGITQAQLAKRGNISEAQLSRIMSLQRAPGSKALVSIAVGLDLPPETVFRAAGILPPAPPLTELDQRVLHYLHQLHPEDQERVMLYLEVLAARYKIGKERP